MTDSYDRWSKATLIHRLKELEAALAQAPSELSLSQRGGASLAELPATSGELVEAQFLLEQSRDRYADLYEFAPLPYVTLDWAGLVTDINLTGAELMGLERSRIVNNPFLIHIVYADRQLFLDHMRRCRQESGLVSSELRLQIRNGDMIWVQLDTRVARGVDLVLARPFRTAVTVLTSRKQAEEALRESEERLKLAQTAAGAGIWDWNLTTNERSWSPEHYQVLGLEPYSVSPSFDAWLQCVHPDDRERCRESGLLIAGEANAVNFEYRVVWPSGEIRWLVSKGKVLTDERGVRSRMIGITIDITDLKRAEERLTHLNEALELRTAEAEQRAAQLGSLASELTQAEERERRRLAQILHDHLQQLLVGSKLKIGILRSDATTPAIRESLQQVEGLLSESIDATRSLTVELSPPILYDAGLPAGLQWLARQMKHKHGLEVDLKVDPDVLPNIDDTGVLLFNFIRELLFNVSKHSGVHQATVMLRRISRNRLLVVVRDRGQGFDSATFKKSFATTERFGLLSIRERLQLIGGKLDIKSKPAKGTTVCIEAPLRSVVSAAATPSETSATAAAESAPATLVESAGEKIRLLLADDHKLFREALAGMLRDTPNMEIVAEAPDGQRAVELARQIRPDIVLMDITMPFLNGIEATKRIVQEISNVAVIGLSAHEEHDMADAMLQAGAVAYISKSGPADDLIATIRAHATQHRKPHSELPQTVDAPEA